MKLQTFLYPALLLFFALHGAVSLTHGHSVPSEFVGTWALTDSEGDLFNVIISPNGTAVSNWTKGDSGAAGEKGEWKLGKDRITIDYEDGWSDIIIRDTIGFLKKSYGPGVSRNGEPTNNGPALRVAGARLPFVGVWQATAVLTGKPFFFALKSDGTARKTITPDAEGQWTVVNGVAIMRWSDDWFSVLERTSKGVVEKVWSPDTPLGQDPTATGEAISVRFRITKASFKPFRATY